MAGDDDKHEIGYVPDETDAEGDLGKGEEQAAAEDHAGKRRHGHRRHVPKTMEAGDILKKTATERDEFKDKYLRSLADMDNFRKRMKKEREDFQKYVLTDFLLELLQIYDNLERALKAKSSDNEKGIISGVEMIRRQFLDLLKKNQVEEIDCLNQPFDPARHEALSKEERQGVAAPLVVEVYQKGFLYQDKLLRPALTKVAVPPAAPPEAAPLS